MRTIIAVGSTIEFLTTEHAGKIGFVVGTPFRITPNVGPYLQAVRVKGSQEVLHLLPGTEFVLAS